MPSNNVQKELQKEDDMYWFYMMLYMTLCGGSVGAGPDNR